MSADIVFGVFLVYGLVFGLRRGFYKELVAIAALLLAIAAARGCQDAAGTWLQQKTGIDAHVTFVLGAVVVFVLVAFVVNLVGRLVLRKLRDPDKDNAIEAAAQKAVDGAEGKLPAGPVTLLTNPIASVEKGLVYWSDKLLGGALGVLKAVTAAYVVFAITYYADMALDGHWRFTQSIRDSRSLVLYHSFIEPFLKQLPEYRLIDNASSLDHFAEDPAVKPNVIERAAAHPAWVGVKGTNAYRALVSDPAVQALWQKRDAAGRPDVDTLLHLSKVRALLADPDFRAAFAAVDVSAILRDALAEPKK